MRLSPHTLSRRIYLGEILRAAEEGTLAPVSCLDCSTGELCPRADECATMPVWRDLGALTSSYLDGKHLSDILEQDHQIDMSH